VDYINIVVKFCMLDKDFLTKGFSHYDFIVVLVDFFNLEVVAFISLVVFPPK
jgi:hypothetical protein